MAENFWRNRFRFYKICCGDGYKYTFWCLMTTSSTDHDVLSNHGESDIWLVKIDPRSKYSSTKQFRRQSGWWSYTNFEKRQRIIPHFWCGRIQQWECVWQPWSCWLLVISNEWHQPHQQTYLWRKWLGLFKFCFHYFWRRSIAFRYVIQ